MLFEEGEDDLHDVCLVLEVDGGLGGGVDVDLLEDRCSLG